MSLFREQQEKFHNNKMFEGDKAYQGGKNISTPYKKPRKGELTLESKAGNKEFSTKDIFAEQVITLVNIFRAPQQGLPLNSRIHSQVILTICGLVTLGTG
ncbi:transposase family protein [Trichormus azollae]|uniref:transposase family protein n=1 Tax=Trichormus azollae TaxID=1164 RepID=UPI00224D0AE3|nr:transposase family protein [Trichormus azollae]